MKKKIKKKGQAEDFIADLIPSLIIIAVGLFILSKMNVENQNITNEREKLLEKALAKEDKILSDYLSAPVKIANKEITLGELISLSYKNEEYKKKVKGQLKNIQSKGVPPPASDKLAVCQYRMCLESEIKYPGNSYLMVEDDCRGEEKIIYFPTYEGGYITMTLSLGKTIIVGTCL